MFQELERKAEGKALLFLGALVEERNLGLRQQIVAGKEEGGQLIPGVHGRMTRE